ncbi:NAD(P)/FAD-dependent oxidoreductase [Ensifer adhaerens]|uniref:NAD(P)/FAD-dependent oxidoreductase n=1 Tax=Ensifer adhaerens TaxID=106592 RepID=UPI001C4DEFDB|nr:FAD-dependent oxidoreductase [Ensifer adhaerens]MBW0371428.1 FAD-dependent oxidoreductase [Ensifer adhaerens]UCM23625.1 FAD-dependent oxidoreductase [Ensifer adhaerens]UCM24395.1 FAD-dependent oxidoreductase [Ensifer adhaerens]
MRFDRGMRGEFGQRRVAVIGAGISGMSAAWLLGKSLEVVLYESSDKPGGHANTLVAPTAVGPVPVDTGFIVYNDRNYPNLVALFDHLDVPTQASNMSFAASLDGGAFEYSGSGLIGLFAQPLNALRPRFWRILSDILRFYREAPKALNRPNLASKTLGEYLDENGYSNAFVTDHLLPMGAAIWSTTTKRMRDYPLHAFIRFCDSHGLLALTDRPRWRTVTGGSREYVSRLMSDYCGELRTRRAVREIRREVGTVVITDRDGNRDTFTDVVIATHADLALAMLAEPDARERELLSAISYTSNKAVLHSDTSLMPRRRNVWSSWNYIGASDDCGERQLCVTYWMNRLQGIDPAAPLFVTLNPHQKIASERIIATFDYDHPLFDQRALASQKELWRLQGRGGVWFCGAYFGSGFHEDGLQSGLAVAEAISGERRPWTVRDDSGRLPSEIDYAAAQ